MRERHTLFNLLTVHVTWQTVGIFTSVLIECNGLVDNMQCTCSFVYIPIPYTLTHTYIVQCTHPSTDWCSYANRLVIVAFLIRSIDYYLGENVLAHTFNLPSNGYVLQVLVPTPASSTCAECTYMRPEQHKIFRLDYRRNENVAAVAAHSLTENKLLWAEWQFRIFFTLQLRSGDEDKLNSSNSFERIIPLRDCASFSRSNPMRFSVCIGERITILTTRWNVNSFGHFGMKSPISSNLVVFATRQLNWSFDARNGIPDDANRRRK